MTRLIGGLLVVSLLYGPAKFQVKYLAYNLLKNVNKIEYAIKKDADSDTPEDNADSKLGNKIENDVDYAYMEFDENANRITALVNEKNMLYNKIESEMDLRSHLRLALNERQIASFVNFMNCYYAEDKIIKENLSKIEPTTVNTANLHNNANYDQIFAEINNVSEYQCNIINSILRIIDLGNQTLQTL